MEGIKPSKKTLGKNYKKMKEKTFIKIKDIKS